MHSVQACHQLRRRPRRQLAADLILQGAGAADLAHAARVAAGAGAGAGACCYACCAGLGQAPVLPLSLQISDAVKAGRASIGRVGVGWRAGKSSARQASNSGRAVVMMCILLPGLPRAN